MLHVVGGWGPESAEAMEEGGDPPVQRDDGIVRMVLGEVRADKASGGEGESHPAPLGGVAEGAGREVRQQSQQTEQVRLVPNDQLARDTSRRREVVKCASQQFEQRRGLLMADCRLGGQIGKVRRGRRMAPILA